MYRGSLKLNWWLVNKSVYVRKKRNILLRVVTSTQRLIIEPCQKWWGFVALGGPSVKNKEMLACVSADTSILKEKIDALLEVLPEHVPDELLSMITGLFSDIVFVNSSPTIGTGGPFNIVYALDFNAATYSQVLTTAGAFKTNLAHE